MNDMTYKTLYFEAEANTTTSTDIEPAVSIDHVNRLANNIATLQKALGITHMTPMAAGSTIKRYKTTVTKGSKQAAEGDIIPLTKVERKPLDPIKLEINLKRKLTTIQAIQASGRAIALDETDTALSREMVKDVRDSFFSMITAGTATAAAGGATLQAAAAQAWGQLSVYFEDIDATPVFFLNPLDVATYLGDASITTQEAFGFRYIESFLGMGTAFISPKVTKGTIFATATENLNGAYVPQGGDVAEAFDLTYDESGMVGMTHSRIDERASIQTTMVSGVVFYPEDASGVIKSQINAE